MSGIPKKPGPAAPTQVMSLDSLGTWLAVRHLMLVRIATSIALLIATGSILETAALAQPSLTAPPARARRQYDRKSEDTATWLAVAGTVIPLGLFALGARDANTDENDVLMAAGLVGFLAGPSTGHLYGTGTIGAPGFLIRSTGALTGMVGIAVGTAGVLGCVDFGPIFGGPPRSAPCDDHASESKTILGVGAALLVGGAIYDIATVGRATRRANVRRFAVAPTLLRSNNQSPTVGLGFSGAF